jgi:ribosome-binding factor A
VLKYMPRLTYSLDTSTERGNRILQLLDEVGGSAPAPPPGDEKKGN